MKANSPRFLYLTGASGVGKSTILEHIKQKYTEIVPMEVSARPYLPAGGSYDKTVTDEIQTLIVGHRTLSSLEQAFKRQPTIFSRGPVDNLAYQRVLGLTPEKVATLNSLNTREVELIKKYGTFIYIPIEFALPAGDELRGQNEEIRKRTDDEIQKIFNEFGIVYYTLKGSIKERTDSLDILLQEEYGFF